MDTLLATYGYDSDDNSNTDENNTTLKNTVLEGGDEIKLSVVRLPPPPLDLLDSFHSIGGSSAQVNRIRSFPHVEGNYALHIFIPVLIPLSARKPLGLFLKNIAPLVPGLHVVDADIKLNELCNDDQKLEKYVFSREFHISLGRTVPILVHQIDSIVSMLRQKLQTQKLDWIELNDWEVFINDDGTRSFLSLEVTGGGLFEITKLIRSVDVVYRLHGLPEFYENAQPHISLLWAIGNIRNTLKQAVKKVEGKSCCSRKRCIFTTRFSRIECKIGKTSYKITKFPDT
ncbi:hypothetical protein ZOSMA_361G00140 [Zostera marina]|uniref:U6 snRNA phosphodiesterase n=1 Tax=Zostera marina TaxID=29655 RepID=A0A0K9P697_ZOSMR|nr:hypothetical protein ZOSMA_361G00140 [Zostera marina]